MKKELSIDITPGNKQTSLEPGYELVIPESVRALAGITMFWQPSMDSKNMDDSWRYGDNVIPKKDIVPNKNSVKIEYDADIPLEDRIQKIIVKTNDSGEVILLTTSMSEREYRVFGASEVVVSTTTKQWALAEVTKKTNGNISRK